MSKIRFVFLWFNIAHPRSHPASFHFEPENLLPVPVICNMCALVLWWCTASHQMGAGAG